MMKNTVPPPRIGIMSSNASSATAEVAAQIATQTTVAAITYLLPLLFTALGQAIHDGESTPLDAALRACSLYAAVQSG